MIRVYNLPEPKKEKAHIYEMWAEKRGFQRAERLLVYEIFHAHHGFRVLLYG